VCELRRFLARGSIGIASIRLTLKERLIQLEKYQW